ncbi:MAG: EamA family transporter [Burkholderiaceae bacterium]|nr:EamA family transporter [Burkholderiaceae bacterium]
MLVGFIGIFIFSLTLPVTKIAVEILNPYFLCFARALLAGILAGAYLIYTKAPIPDAKQIRQFAIVALGVVFVFPLFINIAMTTGEASHAGVILGIMPLATVVAGVLLFQERPSFGFWMSALTGCALVCTYAYLNSRVSQVQLLQPFCTLLASAILVSEPITLMNILFAGLVITTVMIGRQMLVRRAQTV